MKTTKKLLVLCLVAVMAMVSVMPSTFSWYAHNGTVDYQGNEIDYTPSSNRQLKGDGTTRTFSLGTNVTAIKSVTVTADNTTTNPSYTFNASTGEITFTTAPAKNAVIDIRCTHSVPLSLQQSGGLTMTTYKADKDSKQIDGEITTFGDIEAIDAGKTQRYITKIKNNGENPVSVDLEMSNITNDSKVSVGVCSPVINEKSYASRAAVNKVDWDYRVIYFEPFDGYDFWQNYTAPNSPYYDIQTNIFGTNTVENNNDMNLEYQIGATPHPMALEKCSDKSKVYRAFIPASTDSLFFFNHYYVTEDKNMEWNRTPTVSDFYEGRIYYLTGTENSNGYNNKDLGHRDDFTETNLCVYHYYDTATMSVGKTADIGLKKGTKEMLTNAEDFDYFGKEISYSSSDTNVATVSKDGLITAKGTGTATITTTITGEFGDKIYLETKVDVPQSISQVPIAQNIKIGADEEAEIIWYVKNSRASGEAKFDNIFITV